VNKNSLFSQDITMKGENMAITKQKRKISSSTVAIVILSVLLIASIAIGITLAYFTASTTVTGNITLGNPVTISITQGER